MATQDHFSTCASQYASFRPRYPRGLFQWLADMAPARNNAWDCACGNGQASIDLADFFDHVVATDLSAEQLQQAPAHPRIRFRVATAEASGLPAAHFDLVTVAQALHWFDQERFQAEVRRVLRPGGLLVAWSYGVCHLEPAACDAPLQRYYHHVVGPYWPAERRHVEAGYRTLPFPAPELPAPHFDMAREWTLDELLGYVSSWSATAACQRSRGVDPVPALRAELAPLWGEPGTRHPVRWPLSVRATRAAA